MRYFEPALNDTEFGFYWLRVHSRLPLLSVRTGSLVGLGTGDYAASANYFREFPENLNTLGLSFNAEAGTTGIALQGDLAYAIRKSRPEDMLWNRTSADLPHDLGATIVYGHTPNEDFGVRWNCPFSIGIDTGAVYGGPLTAIRLPDETVFQV